MSGKRFLLALCCAALLTGCGPREAAEESAPTPTPPTPTATPIPDPENHVITFADPVIEAETRRLLEKPEGDITEADLLTITEFGRWSEDMVNGDISTLTDLRWFQNLEYLDLSWRGLSRLEGIEGLTQLKTLSLRTNNITDLSPIRGLTNLKRLDCCRNPIYSYSTLCSLPQLEELCIGDNGAESTSLAFLSGMTHLTSLYAPWCGVYDISVLENMPDLEYLQLAHNYINNVSALRDLKKLSYLELGLNNISDVTPLSGLTALTHINVQDNPIPEGALEEFYTPREENYFTDTHYGQLHDSLPRFRFDMRMYFNKKLDGYSVDTITVSDSETGETIQTISIPELSSIGNTRIYTSDESRGFSLEDVNFDGYLDIRFFDCPAGTYLAEYIYLVWEPKISRFVHEPQLSEIPLARFDQEKQLIYGMTKGVDYNYDYTYQYINGVLTLIKTEKVELQG